MKKAPVSCVPTARSILTNTALEQLILAAKDLGVTVQDLRYMLAMGMTPVHIVDYLEARVHDRIH